jgi:hypothetical protein
MTIIRAAFAVLAVAALARLGCPPAAAETYRPWCAQYFSSSGDNGTNCGFISYEQCMMTARGAGAYCVQNPWYLQYGSGEKGSESIGQGAHSRKRDYR